MELNQRRVFSATFRFRMVGYKGATSRRLPCYHQALKVKCSLDVHWFSWMFSGGLPLGMMHIERAI